MGKLNTSRDRFRGFLEFRRRARGGVASPNPDAATSEWLEDERRRRPQKDKATRRRYLRQYIAWLAPFKWTFVGLLTLAAVAAALDMVQPAALGLIIDMLRDDGLSVEEQKRILILSCIGLLGLLLFVRAIETFRWWWMFVVNAKVIHRLRQRLMAHFLKLPLNQISDLKSGGIVSRLSGDVDKVTGLVQMAIISPTVAMMRIILAIVIMFYWNWKLALPAVAMILPMMAISIAWVRRIRPIYKSVSADRNAIDGRVTETFGGIRVVRSFRRELKEQRDYAVAHHLMIRKRLLANVYELTVEMIWELLLPLTALAILWIGGLMVLLHSDSSVGQIIMFQGYSAMLLGPVFRIVNNLSQMQQSLAALERVFEVFEKPVDKPDAPAAVWAPASVEQIRFDRVSFEYRAGVPVIEDFNLEVSGGHVVALVGPSGAGKTTLTDLVARFYDPTQGAILLNGVDLREMRLDSYRGLLGMVQQEVFLFDGTVLENIAYGRRGVEEQQVIEAALRANAHDFIVDLPDGYETLIGERGVKLSGGQRQRISIARAILADPKILILDEATSNLDTESEQLIQAALAELYRNRTTFVIAHRLSTVTHADIIVVMDRGRIVQTGTHDSLTAVDGLYADMVERQQDFGRMPGAVASE